MANDPEKFLQVEESVENLLAALKKLYDEAESYNTSKESLNQVRDKLVDFIASSDDIVKDTFEIIKIVKSIGGPEILRRLDLVIDRLNEASIKNDEALNQIKNEVTNEFELKSQTVLKTLKELKVFCLANMALLIIGFAVIAVLLRK